MGAADRINDELEQQRIAEQRAERAEQARRSAEATLNGRADEALRRRATPELLYRTTVQPEHTVTVTPPTVAANETQTWWQWTQESLSATRGEIEREVAADINRQFGKLHKAVGMVVSDERHDRRQELKRETEPLKRELELTQTQFKAFTELQHEREALRVTQIENLRRELAEDSRREINSLRQELEQTQSKVNTQAELEREREALRAKAIAADQVERDSLRRDIIQLCAELDLLRSLSSLRSEVATARSEIPKLPAIVAEIHTETSAARSEAERRIAALERELKLAKDKIANLRVEQSQTAYGLKQLEDAKPGVELKLQTSETSLLCAI